MAAAPEEVGALARRPPVIVLAALAALSALSAIWTEGSPTDALRWGLVLGGYAALAIATGTIAGRRPVVLAGGVCMAALLTGAVGLIAMAQLAEPLALELDGSWRPAGPFEYPPALAALQVMALPTLLWAVSRRGGAARVAAAAAAAVALAVVVLSGSRLQMAFALAILLVGALLVRRRGPSAAKGGDRRALVAPAVTVLVGLASVAAALAISPGQDNGPLGVDLGHGREDTWTAAVEAGRERPWLGSGAETFELVTASHQRMTAVRHAHNLPLEAWVELGAGGLLLAVALYLSVAAALWRIRAQPAAWLFGAATAVFLATNLLDWSWHLAGIGAVWAVCLGGVLAEDT